MNNSIGERLPRMTGGYFERGFHLKDSSHIQTHDVFNRRASVFSLFIKKKPNRVGMSKYTCYLTSAPSQAIQTETGVYDFMADRMQTL
jgi:hypothetical protein